MAMFTIHSPIIANVSPRLCVHVVLSDCDVFRFFVILSNKSRRVGDKYSLKSSFRKKKEKEELRRSNVRE